MAIQKIISILVIFSCLLFYACGVSSKESINSVENSVDSVLIDTSINMNVDIVENCLESIGLEVTDSIFLYWTELAINKKDLFEHAGNRRILITQDKKFYYSRNKGAIKGLDNYFNTDLFLYKTLSDNDFGRLKEALIEWNVLNLPPTMSNEDVIYDGGTESYLYLNFDGKKSCTKFDMGVEERIKIEEILKSVQE